MICCPEKITTHLHSDSTNRCRQRPPGLKGTFPQTWLVSKLGPFRFISEIPNVSKEKDCHRLIGCEVSNMNKYYEVLSEHRYQPSHNGLIKHLGLNPILKRSTE